MGAAMHGNSGQVCGVHPKRHIINATAGSQLSCAVFTRFVLLKQVGKSTSGSKMRVHPSFQ